MNATAWAVAWVGFWSALFFGLYLLVVAALL